MAGAEGLLQSLVNRGYPPHVAAGIIGNMEQESKFDPAAVGDGGNAYGLMQWNGPRKIALERFASSRGVPVSDPETQIDFMDQEMRSTGLYDMLNQARSAAETAKLISDKYERPNPRLANNPRRMDVAERILNTFFSPAEAAEMPSQDNQLAKIKAALRAADAAGNVDDARRLANAYRKIAGITSVPADQPAEAAQEPQAPPSLIDKGREFVADQFDSLTNPARWPSAKDAAAQTSTPEARDKMLTSAAVSGMPSSLVNSAVKRVSLGAGSGYAHGETDEEKWKNAGLGAMLSIGAESVPMVQGIFKAGKRALVDPTASPETVVAATLKRFAADPENPQILEATTKALENPVTYVRGSNPTTPEASRNGGLWALYKAAMAREPAADRAIQDAKNIARLKAFKELGVGENAAAPGGRLKASAVQDLNKAEDALKDTPIDLKAVEQQIDDLLNSGAAKTPQIEKTLKDLKRNLYSYSNPEQIETALNQVQGIRTAANRAVYGENGIKIAGPVGEQLSGISGQVVGGIDDAIEEALKASGNEGLHQAFKQKYALGSKLEKRASVLRDLLTKGSSPGEVPVIGETAPGQFGPTGETQAADVLSMKLSNVLRGNSPTVRNARQVLTEKQLERLNAIDQDIRRSVPKEMKRGSDTFSNLSSDYILQNILGDAAGKGLGRSAARGIAAAIKKTPVLKTIIEAIPSAHPLENDRIREILVKALRDPKYAADLMRRYEQSGLWSSTVPARTVPSLLEALEGNGGNYQVPNQAR